MGSLGSINSTSVYQSKCALVKTDDYNRNEDCDIVISLMGAPESGKSTVLVRYDKGVFF